ncbi:hypothetical protein ACFL6I_18065 [candidate division KSB1 bacterium]
MKTIAIGSLKKFTLIFFLIVSFQSNGQLVEGYGLFKHWHLGLNIGVTSFVGDLSQYDLDVFKKLNYESDFAMKGFIGKKISPTMSVRGQMIYGKLISEKGENYFNTTFVETTGQLLMNVNRIFNKTNLEPKCNFYIYCGGGLIHFWAIQRKINDDEIITSEGYDEEGKTKTSPTVGEMVTAGVICRIQMSNKLDLTIDGSFHVANTDYLDAQIGGHSKMDMFSDVSVGLTYKIKRLYKMWKPILTKKHKESMRTWSKNKSIFRHKKRGVKNLGNTFAVLKKY